MDLLFSAYQEDELVAQSFLEYQGDTRLSLPLLITVLKEYRSLEDEDCTSELERAVLAFRAIDCYLNNTLNDDIDYDTVQNYVPKMSDGDLDGSGEIYIDDDLDCTGADVEIKIDLDRLTAQLPVEILDLASVNQDEYSLEEARDEDLAVLKLVLEQEDFSLEQLEQVLSVLRNYEALSEGNSGIIIEQKVICPLVETNY